MSNNVATLCASCVPICMGLARGVRHTPLRRDSLVLLVMGMLTDDIDGLVIPFDVVTLTMSVVTDDVMGNSMVGSVIMNNICSCILTH